jgi:type I restriction enzyme M protein
MPSHKVAFLNPRTCGIYKNGAPRYKTDPETGQRTDAIDNELIEAVEAYVRGHRSQGEARVDLKVVQQKKLLVPTYYDKRYDEGMRSVLNGLSTGGITIGELIGTGIITVRGGHGSPGNDQRTGHVPYVKVSDIRGLRINVNPTNLVTESVARRFWRSESSGLEPWDVITPNRASSNIGEFAILLPGEEQVVLTKEVFVFRVIDSTVWDPFYLLWALSLRAVRNQWKRIALMQTNREDCGDRYREIILPNPTTHGWALERSAAFRDYFQTIAGGKAEFIRSVTNDGCEYIASVVSSFPEADSENDEDSEESGTDSVDTNDAESAPLLSDLR